jgi:nicotinamide riboside kinase
VHRLDDEMVNTGLPCLQQHEARQQQQQQQQQQLQSNFKTSIIIVHIEEHKSDLDCLLAVAPSTAPAAGLLSP